MLNDDTTRLLWDASADAQRRQLLDVYKTFDFFGSAFACGQLQACYDAYWGERSVKRACFP